MALGLVLVHCGSVPSGTVTTWWWQVARPVTENSGNSTSQYSVVIFALRGILRKPRDESIACIYSCLSLPTFLLFQMLFFVFCLFPYGIISLQPAKSSLSFYFTFIFPPLSKDALVGYIILEMWLFFLFQPFQHLTASIVL